jgi:hypothetical protein
MDHLYQRLVPLTFNPFVTHVLYSTVTISSLGKLKKKSQGLYTSGLLAASSGKSLHMFTSVMNYPTVCKEIVSGNRTRQTSIFRYFTMLIMLVYMVMLQHRQQKFSFDQIISKHTNFQLFNCVYK